MKVFKVILIVFIAVFFLINCISSREFTGDIEKISESYVVIVGSIELKPPLEEYEQQINPLTLGDVKNRIIFGLGDKIIHYGDKDLSNIKYGVGAKFGQVFFIKQKYAKKLYISHQYVYLEIKDAAREMYFPVVIQIEVPAGCKVAYIGKIRYHRDIYSAITKVEIIDNYEQAKLKLEERYKKQVDMCRAKVKILDQE